MQTIAETRYYLSRAEKRLTLKERERIVMTLAIDPLAGDLIVRFLAMAEEETMTKKAFEGIMSGLHDALAMARGDKKAGKVTRVSVRAADVKAARKQVGLTRDEFASAFGLSAATLRKWENGERHPTGAARALLTIIAREPDAVLRAIRK